MLSARLMSNGFWAVDDGEHLLTACPCCGKSLTEAAANTIAERVGAQDLSFAELLQAEARREKNPSPFFDPANPDASR